MTRDKLRWAATIAFVSNGFFSCVVVGVSLDVLVGVVLVVVSVAVDAILLARDCCGGGSRVAPRPEGNMEGEGEGEGEREGEEEREGEGEG